MTATGRVVSDVVRAACVVAVAAAAASVVVEMRLRLAAIDVAHRAAVAGHASPVPMVGVTPPAAAAGPVERFGQASVQLADAVLGVFR